MLGKIENMLLYAAIAATAVLCLMITGNVVARALFNTSLPDSIVIVRELMVAAILLPLAAATADRAHVVVEFVADRFSPRIRAWLVIFGSVMGLVALAPLIYASLRELAHAIESGEYFFGDLELPLWPGRLVFLLGLSVCWLRLLVLVIQDISSVRAGNLHFDSVVDTTSESN